MSAVLASVATLGDLASEINIAVRDAQGHAQSAVAEAMKAGRMLLRAKECVQHGEWQSWIAANCEVAPRTAQAYTRLAGRVPALPAPEAQRVADLPLREAIRAIATRAEAPKTHSSARTIRAKDPDQAKQAVAALRKGVDALCNTARHIEDAVPISPRDVEALRASLAAAMDALDGLTSRRAISAAGHAEYAATVSEGAPK
jgi:hypothetical protein